MKWWLIEVKQKKNTLVQTGKFGQFPECVEETLCNISHQYLMAWSTYILEI